MKTTEVKMCDANHCVNFQHHYITVFSVTWSFSNLFNLLICCSRNILYYY